MYRILLYSYNVCKAILSVTLFIICIFVLNGCTPYVVTKTVYPELSLPVKPLLPKVAAKEIECLSNHTVKKFKLREIYIIDYSNDLEDIINKVNEQHKKDIE